MGGQRRRRQRQRRSIGPFDRARSGRRDPARRALPARRRLGRRPRTRRRRVAVGDRRPPTATPRRRPRRPSKKKREEGGADARHAAARRPPARVYVCVGRRDRQGGRQRRVPRDGPEHQDVPLASASARTSATATCRMRVERQAPTRAADIGEPIGYEIRPGKKPERLSRGRARRSSARVSVRAGIIVTGTEVLVGHHPRRQRAVAVRGAARARRRGLRTSSSSATGRRTCARALDFLARPST